MTANISDLDLSPTKIQAAIAALPPISLIESEDTVDLLHSFAALLDYASAQMQYDIHSDPDMDLDAETLTDMANTLTADRERADEGLATLVTFNREFNILALLAKD